MFGVDGVLLLLGSIRQNQYWQVECVLWCSGTMVWIEFGVDRVWCSDVDRGWCSGALMWIEFGVDRVASGRRQ